MIKSSKNTEKSKQIYIAFKSGFFRWWGGAWFPEMKGMIYKIWVTKSVHQGSICKQNEGYPPPPPPLEDRKSRLNVYCLPKTVFSLSYRPSELLSQVIFLARFSFYGAPEQTNSVAQVLQVVPNTSSQCFSHTTATASVAAEETPTLIPRSRQAGRWSACCGSGNDCHHPRGMPKIYFSPSLLKMSFLPRIWSIP